MVQEKDVGAAEGGTKTMDPVAIGLVLVAFAGLQVGAYTFFKLAHFDGFTIDSFLGLLKEKYFWTGVLCSGGILILSFTLVRVAESSLMLVLLLYLNSIIVSFLLLPLAWRAVFDEQIFTSYDRVVAFGLALLSAGGLFIALYLWNRGG
jgi:hypothetical protein